VHIPDYLKKHGRDADQLRRAPSKNSAVAI
jgi:hypothetical protein